MAKPKWPACEKPQANQSQSPLFGKIPGEVRNKIFKYALSVYEDQSRAFDKNTSYRRPGYTAPHKIDFALLQTCQKVYSEAWDIPLTTNLITADYSSITIDRPFKLFCFRDLREGLLRIYQAHGSITLSHVRLLGSGEDMNANSLFSRAFVTKNFNPTILSLSARHTSWDGWLPDDHNRLRLYATWVNSIFVPESVKELRLELETIKHKAPLLDRLTMDICHSWQVRKTNGEIMTAHLKDCQTVEWTGSSISDNKRFLRDESQPNLIAYYGRTVIFKVEQGASWRGPVPDLEQHGPQLTRRVPFWVRLDKFTDFTPDSAEAQDEKLVLEEMENLSVFNARSTRDGAEHSDGEPFSTTVPQEEQSPTDNNVETTQTRSNPIMPEFQQSMTTGDGNLDGLLDVEERNEDGHGLARDSDDYSEDSDSEWNFELDA